MEVRINKKNVRKDGWVKVVLRTIEALDIWLNDGKKNSKHGCVCLNKSFNGLDYSHVPFGHTHTNKTLVMI